MVPLLNVGRSLAGIGLVVLGRGRVVAVVLAPLYNLLEDSLVDLTHALAPARLRAARKAYVGNRNSFLKLSDILQHVLDQDGTLSNLLVWSGQRSQRRPGACSGGRSGGLEYTPTVMMALSELWSLILPDMVMEEGGGGGGGELV